MDLRTNLLKLLKLNSPLPANVRARQGAIVGIGIRHETTIGCCVGIHTLEPGALKLRCLLVTIVVCINPDRFQNFLPSQTR
jgi:hypothetical protein